MRYQWDLFKMRSRFIFLKECYQNENDKTLKITFKELMESYQEMLKLSFKKKEEKNSSLDDSQYYNNFHEFILKTSQEFQSNDLSCLNFILQSYLPFKEQYLTSESLSDIKISSTNDEIVNITKDFITKYVPTTLHKNLDFLFFPSKENINKLQISYSPVETTYGGITYIDPFFQEKYIYIARKNHLLDLGITPHESFHYLITDFDDYKKENYNSYYLTEVEGSFADILFGDYFYQNSIEFRNYFNQYRLQVYENEVCDLVIENAFIDSLTQKGRFRINKFNQTLEVYDIIPFHNKEEITKYMTIPMDINMKYAMSFLVAIDLFYIYQKDPEFSFYLLKNIHFMKEENDIIGLLRRNHITFMDDGYENLKKYVKKIERQN